MTFFFLGFGPRDDEEAERQKRLHALRQIAFDELGTKCVAMIHMVANRFVPKDKVIPSTAKKNEALCCSCETTNCPIGSSSKNPRGAPRFSPLVSPC